MSPAAPVPVTAAARRRLIARRHCLGGQAADVQAAVAALVALHATDPASVYLSVLARCSAARLADVSVALYETRSLVRWMGMRRTLFVVARDDVALVQAAAGAEVAAAMRRRLISRIQRNGCEPPITGDVGRWLADVSVRVEAALAGAGSATGAQLAALEPALGTVIEPGTPSERPARLTTSLLTLLGAEGRIVRGAATGAWTTRAQRWEPVSAWWPEGLEVMDVEAAQRELASRWLARFGPATVQDLRWWTGWGVGTTRRALAGVALCEVDLDGEPGIALAAGAPVRSGADVVDAPDLAEELTRAAEDPPAAALLPALDPTPMGYTRREWFLGVDPGRLFDRAGNIAPTLWWDGEIVGAWAVTLGGDVATAVLADRGAEARAAIEAAVGALQPRLEGAVVSPAFQVPLERELAAERA